MAQEVSHGRGGAGNINVDDTQYADGEVVRTGVAGSHGDGAFSAGRGGAGNISDVGTPTSERKDRDVVPEAAIRASQDHQDHHRILPVPKALDQVQSYQSARARPSVLKGSCRQTPASCRWRTISLGR
jgi:hypothetical protein